MIAGIIALVIIIALAISGREKGAVSMIYSFVSVIIAFLVSRVLIGMMLNNQHLEGISFPVAFIILMTALATIGRALRLVDRIPIVGSVNRLLGMIAGALVGYGIVLVVLYAVDLLDVFSAIASFSAKFIDNDPIIAAIRSVDFISMLDVAKREVDHVREEFTQK